MNQPYPNTQLTATGGALPYTWSVNPALPNGLSLNPSSGVISGTPLSGSNGVTSHTFTVTDSTLPTNQTNSTAPKSLTINANVTSVTITTASLPNGTVNQSYTAPLLAASGGTSPYNWSVNSGSSLPSGLSLSAGGEITGTPTTPGTTTTAFKVLDSTVPNQQFAIRSIAITINAAAPPLTITTTTLPAGTVGQAYSTTLAAAGGTPPLTWSLASGSDILPAGLALDANTGVISGTPTTNETRLPTFRVIDSGAPQQSAQKQLSMTINPAATPLTITTTSPLPSGKVRIVYTATLTATGGTTPYSSWGVTPALPTGLSLDPSTGAITGTPGVGTAGTTSHTFSVQDSTSTTANKPNISLTIDP